MNKVVFKAFGEEELIKSSLINVLGDKYSFSIKSEYNDNLIQIDFENEGKETIRDFEQKIYQTIGKNIYFDADVSLSEVCSLLLKTYGKKLGIAESITGGQIVDSFIKLSGASEIVNEGLVCYANESKIKVLGVSPKTIMKYTAVSREVAYEMVRGLLLRGYNDYGLATTGYAENYNGKDNGGIVYVGVGDENRIDVQGYRFFGDRDKIRKLATNAAIFHLIKKVKGSFEYMG